MKKLTKVSVVFTLGLFALGSFFINKVEAVEGCGEIYYQDDISFPVINCLNPFDKTHDETGFIIEGQVIENGSKVVVGEDGTNDYGFAGETFFNKQNFYIYRHDGMDFHAVNTNYSYPTEEAIIAKISEYFDGNQIYINQYKEIYFSSRKYDYFNLDGQRNFDTQLNRYVEDVYEEMELFLESTIRSPRAVLLPGTYTLVRVDTDEGPSLSQRNIFEVIKDWLIPKAYAYYNVYTVTFTLLDKEPAPSVLFLPGIMGSRLYEESDACNFFGGVDEVERWVSVFDCDVQRLVMDENGVSINNLYTKAEEGVVEDVGYVSNLYDSFFEQLEELKDENKISDYRGVPYDWRLRLGDVLKMVNIGGRISLDPDIDYKDGYVYKSLAAMVEASPNRKVVLVGHSNGGLVIKTLLATMKAHHDPLLDSIEKVILVAVPQAGTPEAVVGMLHGVAIGKGLVVSKEQSRQLINTAPFGYHLLPTADYFEMIETPVITIETGSSTDAWRGQFGAEIDTPIELKYFLEKESGRATPEWGDTKTPATAYSGLINYASNAHNSMMDWKPANTLVYEVAGSGIETPANITYFTDTHCVRGDVLMDGTVICAETAPELGYRINKAVDGDGTVLVPSALALPIADGSEKFFINLKEYNSFLSLERIHKDIFEVQSVIDLLSDIVSSGTLGGYNHVSKSEPNYEGENRLVYQLHSPLDLFVILSDGEVVGSSTPSLRGVEYSRYGEVQYLSIPESESDYLVRLSGVASGSFTLDIEAYEGNTMLERTTYSAIPSSTSTQVIIETAEDAETVLEIDYEGDGIFEAVARPGLAIINPVSALATTTPKVVETKKPKSSGTKVGVRGLPKAPVGNLSSAVVTTPERELLLKIIQLLTQYRDLLMVIRVQ